MYRRIEQESKKYLFQSRFQLFFQVDQLHNIIWQMALYCVNLDRFVADVVNVTPRCVPNLYKQENINI